MTQHGWPHVRFSPGAFAERIAASGMTPEDLDHECDLRPGTCRSLSEGKYREPYLWHFWRMAQALDEDMDDLFDDVYEVSA